MEKLHIIIGILSSLLIVLFMIPLVTHKILNIGNATGIAVFLLCLLLVIFRKPVGRFIGWFWTKIPGKILLSILGMAVLTVIIIVLAETYHIVKETHNRPKTDVTLVVLGCAVYGENPSRILNRRIKAAGEYLIEHPKACAVLSGGKGDGENISEAECMYRALVNMGIDGNRLYLEDQSESTRQNLAFSYEIIKSKDLCENIAIVTSNFHCYRASLVAKDLGLTTSSVPASTLWYALPTYYVRELYGILYQHLL